MTSHPQPSSPWIAGRPLWVLMALTVMLLAASGRLEPSITRDTASYLVSGSWSQLLVAPRHPLYGALVGALGHLPGALHIWVPALQTTVYLLAVGLWFAACLRAGLGRRAGLALSLPLVLANLVILWNNAVHPELLAAAFVLLAMGAVLDLATGEARRAHRPLVQLGVGLGLAYLLRPANLPLALTLPLLVLLLSRLLSRRWRPGLALAALGAASLPFVMMASVRLASVGHFHIVSFGGFAMAGMAGQMLDSGMVERLDEDLRPLALAIVEGRDALVARNEALAVPLNSRGQRDFNSMAFGYFDIVARNYDSVLFGVVLKQRNAGESWVDFDRRMQHFTIAVLRAAPQRYAVWLVGASTRATGRLLVTGAAFVAASLALVFLYPAWLMAGRARVYAPPAPPDIGLHAMLLIVACYTLSNLVPAVAVTFPAARYIDTAGLFIAALPIYALMRLLADLKHRH